LYDSGGLLELIKCSYHYIFGQMESRIWRKGTSALLSKLLMHWRVQWFQFPGMIPIPRKVVDEEHKTGFTGRC
jgi:hypothetical protein